MWNNLIIVIGLTNSLVFQNIFRNICEVRYRWLSPSFRDKPSQLRGLETVEFVRFIRELVFSMSWSTSYPVFFSH